MKNTKKEYIIVFVFFTFLVFGLLIVTGTLTSGMHYVDDHEFFRYDLMMKSDRSNFFGCLKDVLQHDLSQRFRPLYNILRVCLVAIIGTDFFVASIIKAIEIIFILFLFYLSAKFLNCNMLYSILFSLIIMVGPQSVVWWKLGPQESTGTLFFSCGFYFLLKWLSTNKVKFCIISVIFFVCATLYKESYVLTLPFVMVYIIYDKCKDYKLSYKNIKDTLIKVFPLLLIFSMVFIIEIIVIIFYVGTNKIGYAGIDLNTSFSEYKNSWESALRNYLKWFIYFGIPMFLVLLSFIKKWEKIAGYFILSFVFILPQCFLYLKTGLEERYILPWVFGYSFLMVIVPNKLFDLEKKVTLRKRLYTCLLLGLLIPHFVILFKEAQYFTYNGKSISEVLEIALLNSNSDTKILSAYSPYYESDLTVSYWMLKNERKNIYIWNEDEKKCTIDFGSNQGEAAPASDMDIILFYNNQNRHYCYIPDIDLTDYEIIEIGTLTYCKKR